MASIIKTARLYSKNGVPKIYVETQDNHVIDADMADFLDAIVESSGDDHTMRFYASYLRPILVSGSFDGDLRGLLTQLLVNVLFRK